MRTLILIDTHILIWFVENNPRLSQMQLEQIVDPDNQIAVSIVTLWEIVIKQSLGKLPDFTASMDDLLAELDKNNISVLPLQPTHLARLRQLPLFPQHKDPFDRLIVATAFQEACYLMSNDRNFALYAADVRLIPD